MHLNFFLKEYRAFLPTIFNLKRQRLTHKGDPFVVTPLARFARSILDLWTTVERVAVKVLHCKIWIWNWMVLYRLRNDFFDLWRRLSVRNRNPYGKTIFGDPTFARNLRQGGRGHSARAFREPACPAFWFRSLHCHSWVFGGKTQLWPIHISRCTLSW